MRADLEGTGARRAVVLAGGRGVRRGSLTDDVPKPLLEVAGRPFLEWVLRSIREADVTEVVIAAGYRASQIEALFRSVSFRGLSLTVLSERTPLGTAGAIANACNVMTGDEPVLVTNGDSCVATDLSIAFSRLTPDLDATMLSVTVADRSRFGRVEVTRDGVLARLGSPAAGKGLINAGVYVLRRRLVRDFSKSRPLSLERDVLPRLITAGAKIGVVTVEAPFIDIGVPDSLEVASRWVSQNLSSAR